MPPDPTDPTTPPLRVSVAGTVSVAGSGGRVDDGALPGSQARLTFVALVLERRRVLPRDELAELLWPERLPGTWESALRNVVSRVREFLDAAGLPAADLLRHDAGGYRLELPAGTIVDVEEAERLVELATERIAAGDGPAAVEAAVVAHRVLSLPVLPGILSRWLEPVRDRLGHLALRAGELEAEARLLVGDELGALAAVEAVIDAAPFRETAHRIEVRIHEAAGNRAEALQAYERCRRLLAEELGVDPSPETEALYLRLLGTEPSSAPVPPAPEEGDAGLLGRDDDLARVEAALHGAPLVTISGPGGVGKTRLAVAAASATGVAPPERRWWVDLASADAASVSHLVADVVGASQAGANELDAAVAELRHGPSLLVLDNCEHVVAAAGGVAAALLAACPELAVLATSQAALGLPGEAQVELLPLPAPAEGASFGAITGSPAVEVFARRARAANAAFELTPENGLAVAEICRRLDGLPLALELAAARVRSIRPDQIAAHLDERFRLVRRARQDDGSRHSSLDATIRWSYDLLDEHEQRVFDHLSLFLGAFDLDAAMAVAGAGDAELLDVLESLDSLVERSMLVAVESPTVTRYRLLETLRAFGRRGLDGRGELADARARHRDHHLAVVEAGAVGLGGPDEPAWVETIHRVLPDVRAAFVAAAAEGDVDTCLRTVVALFDYAFFRLQRQVGEWAVEAVSLPGAADHPAYGDAAAVAGYLAWGRGDLVAAERWASAGLAAGSVGLAADALGTLAVFKGEIDTAIGHWELAAQAARDAGHTHREAISLGQVAFGTMLAGRDDAVDLAVAAKEVAAVAGSPSAAAHASWSLGIALYDRDPVAALAELEAAMAIGATVDNRLAIGSAKVPAEELRTKLARRSWAADARSAVDNLEYWVTAGHPPNLWSTVRRVARGLAGLGAHRWAAFAIGAEQAAQLKLPLRERERLRHDAVVSAVRAALGDEAFAAEVDRGGSVTPEQLVAELREAVDLVGGDP